MDLYVGHIAPIPWASPDAFLPTQIFPSSTHGGYFLVGFLVDARGSGRTPLFKGGSLPWIVPHVGGIIRVLRLVVPGAVSWGVVERWEKAGWNCLCSLVPCLAAVHIATLVANRDIQ